MTTFNGRYMNVYYKILPTLLMFEIFHKNYEKIKTFWCFSSSGKEEIIISS